MKYLAIVFLIVILAVGGFILVSSNKPKTNEGASPAIEKTEAVDYKASFAIFTNGTFRIFTDLKYHNQSEDVYIQGNNPNIVHVKKSDTTWNNFFATLPLKLTKECLTTGTGQTFCSDDNDKLRFYLNDKEDPDALDKNINNGDHLVVSFGK